MALRLSITKSAYDKLPEALQNEYFADGDGFKLDVPDLPDTTALKSAKDREVKARNEANARARAAEEKAAELEATLETTKADFDKQLKSTLGEKEEALNKANGFLQKTLVDSVAKDVANEISTVPAIMSTFIASRLSVDMTGDSPSTVILDANGKPSKMTMDELKAEFTANKDYTPIIKGNPASGGGAPRQNQPSGSNNGGGSTGSALDYAAMSDEELGAHFAQQSQTSDF